MKARKQKRVATWTVLLVAAAVTAGIGAGRVSADLISDLLNINLGLMSVMPEPLIDPLSDPPGKFNAVKPQEFDPARTNLVQSAWLPAIGCPSGAIVANPNADFTGVESTSPYADLACTAGDPNDSQHEGLLLVKTGPTSNFASAAAELINVKGITLTELGYDIRKQASTAGIAGSHCGAGAPRFVVVTIAGTVHFVGCNSPTPAQVPTTTTGWIRLRWDAALLATAFPPILPTDVVRRIVIIFDEGQDASGGPDQFGAAIIDNINVNGKMVGRGATDAS